MGTYVTQWRTTPTTVNLTYADAEGQFGRDNLLAFQNSFLDRRGTASRFPGQVATEAKEHPGRDVGRVVEVGFLFVPVAEEVEGIKMSVELHWAFVELLKALEGEE